MFIMSNDINRHPPIIIGKTNDFPVADNSILTPSTILG